MSISPSVDCSKCAAAWRGRREAEKMEIDVRKREEAALAENQALRDKIDILTKELRPSVCSGAVLDKIDALTKENYNLRQDKVTAAGVVGTLRAQLDVERERNALLEKKLACTCENVCVVCRLKPPNTLQKECGHTVCRRCSPLYPRTAVGSDSDASAVDAMIAQYTAEADADTADLLLRRLGATFLNQNPHLLLPPHSD